MLIMIREKYFIICNPDLASLNKRNELISSCRLFVFQVVVFFCLMAFLIASLVTPYILFF